MTGKELQHQITARVHQVTAFHRTLTEESDRACALMAVAFLDETFKDWFRGIFVEHPSVENLFEGNGALDTFASRIKVAFALGMLCEQHVRDLNLMRKVRNDFAHDPGPLSFDEPRIASKCLELRSHIRNAEDGARSIFTNTASSILAFIHTSMSVSRHATIPENVPPNQAVKEQIEDLQRRFSDRQDEYIAALNILQEDYLKKVLGAIEQRSDSHSCC